MLLERTDKPAKPGPRWSRPKGTTSHSHTRMFPTRNHQPNWEQVLERLVPCVCFVLFLKSPLAKKRKPLSNDNLLCLWPTTAEIHYPLAKTSLALRHFHGILYAAHLGSGCLTCRDGGPHSQQPWRRHQDSFWPVFNRETNPDGCLRILRLLAAQDVRPFFLFCLFVGLDWCTANVHVDKTGECAHVHMCTRTDHRHDETDSYLYTLALVILPFNYRDCDHSLHFV